MGFEPATYGLQNRCSTTELYRQMRFVETTANQNTTKTSKFVQVVKSESSKNQTQVFVKQLK